MRLLRISATSIAVLALAPSTGCKRRPDPMSYLVDSPDLSLNGATMVTPAGRVTLDRSPWNKEIDHVGGQLDVPRSAPMLAGATSLEVRTPCGAKTFALKTKETSDEEKRSRDDEYGPFHLHVDPAAKLPPSVIVWVGAGASEKVRLGDMDLASGRNIVFDPGCRATSPMTVNGAALATFDAPKDAATTGYFVTTKRGVCYHYERVNYQRGDGIATGRTLSGSQLYAINPELNIVYFLAKAPSSQKVQAGTFAVSEVELVEERCK